MAFGNTTRRGWIGLAIVSTTLFLWALAPSSPSYLWMAALLVSGIAAGLTVIEGIVTMQGRSLFRGRGGDG